VLYNGNPKWTAATDFASLLGENNILGKYTPQLHYCLIDESQYDLENLRQMGNLVSTLIIAKRCTDMAAINQAFLGLYDKYDRRKTTLHGLAELVHSAYPKGESIR
jgi:hypothetical protein